MLNGSGSIVTLGLSKAGALKTCWFQRISRVKLCRTAAKARTAGEAERLG